VDARGDVHRQDPAEVQEEAGHGVGAGVDGHGVGDQPPEVVLDLRGEVPLGAQVRGPEGGPGGRDHVVDHAEHVPLRGGLRLGGGQEPGDEVVP
jgi:hypothetical protein